MTTSSVIMERARSEGDRITVTAFLYTTDEVKSRDFTISVYSKQSDITITDENGGTNMLHMDGQKPGGWQYFADGSVYSDEAEPPKPPGYK